MFAKDRNDFTDWLTDMLAMAESSRQYREGYAWAVNAVVRARKTRARLEKAIDGDLAAISPADAFKEG